MPAIGNNGQPTRSFSFMLAAIAGLLSCVTLLYMRKPPPPPAPNVQCKMGFMRLSCSPTAYCVRKSGQCVPSAVDGIAPAPSSAPSFQAAAKAHKADTLVARQRRSVDSCLAAADLYEEAADASTGAAAAEFQLKAGDALNCAMRIKGTGNILILEGTLDTPANKKFWGAHGPRALALIKSARAAHAPLRSDAAATAIEMDAFMYSSSSKGILRQPPGAHRRGLDLPLPRRRSSPQRLLDSSWDGFVGALLLPRLLRGGRWATRIARPRRV